MLNCPDRRSATLPLRIWSSSRQSWTRSCCFRHSHRPWTSATHVRARHLPSVFGLCCPAYRSVSRNYCTNTPFHPHYACWRTTEQTYAPPQRRWCETCTWRLEGMAFWLLRASQTGRSSGSGTLSRRHEVQAGGMRLFSGGGGRGLEAVWQGDRSIYVWGKARELPCESLGGDGRC
jgi:hypothetical protein